MVFKLSAICSFCFVMIASKTIAQEVVTASGSYYESEQGSISWTLGETLIETFQAGELILTQGFQQPALSVATYVEGPAIDFQLTAFPNPTKGQVTISTDFLDAENLEYVIYDMQGRNLFNKTLDGPHTGIAFDDFHPGTYFIRLSNKGVTLKIFKIIKN